MPLDKVKAETIIGLMRSQDVQARLDAINKSREMFKDAFKDCKTDADYAFAAYCIETCYNLVKDELRAGIQERIGKTAESGNGLVIKAEKKEPKPKKATAKVMDIKSLMSDFAAFTQLQNQKKE